ncbi:unnamed protein product, partial [Meganyctiphanes norvegica]
MVKLICLFLCASVWSCVESVEVNTTEAEPSSGGNGLEAVLQGPGAALSLLLDIRDLLAGEGSAARQRPQQQDDNHQEAVWRDALGDHRKTTDQTLEILSDSVKRVSSGVTQKVELIMESFAALKMLVQAQEAQIQRLQTMVEKVQGTTDDLGDQARDFRLSLGALETRLLKQDQGRGPSDLSAEESKPEQFYSRILFIDDNNINKTENRSQEDMYLRKDLQTCLYDVKNEVESLKSQIQNIDTSKPTVVVNKANVPTDQPGVMNSDISTTNSDHSRLESIINNLERIQTRQQVSLDDVNYKVSMVDNLVTQVRNIDNITTFHGYKMDEMQSTINGLNRFKGDIGTFKEMVTVVEENVENVISNVTDINKDIQLMKTNMESTNKTTSVVNEGLCVHPYLRGAGGCFHVHTKSRLAWRQAREHCRTIQGDLAAPRNFTSFKDHLLSQRLSRSYTYWLGASDNENEGTWKWVDGREVGMGSAVWQSGQPNE